MSHTTKLKSIAIRDISALRSAVAEIKASGVECELVEKQTPRMYSPQQEKDLGVCDYVLRLPNSRYDVGFEKQQDGSYIPVFDDWNNQVGSQIGAACPMPGTKEGNAQHAIGRFMQSYLKHATTNIARAKGQMVQSCHVNPNGEIKLVLSGY